jgi:L-alanine-DL-glutamate epimerase-like enolase superfamily enzyme
MKLTRIETIHLGADSAMPALLLVRLHTDEGLVGEGETYYTPEATRAIIHELAAPVLLGGDPLAIEGHWRSIYEMCSRFGARGTEMRALSALDVALWDILGQAAGLPVYQVLGGASRDRIKTYNTCAGPLYGRTTRPGSWVTDLAGTLDDLQAFQTHADELARDLLSEGIKGMKIWPFDVFAQQKGGLAIEYRDLDAGLEPVRKIRDAVGYEMDIMIEAHGYWSLPAAVKIARALEEHEPAWVEDLIRADDPTALASLCRETSIPVLASEYLMTRWDYRQVLDARAADILMIDPIWCGGITEARKIASMADTYNVPVTMHDCTGPLSLYAGLHLTINAPNALYQETVRAYLRTFYRDLVTDLPEIVDGHILAPTAPGLGTRLQPDIGARPGATVVVSDL